MQCSNIDHLEELCVEISDFCRPKMAPQLNREDSLWVSGFLKATNKPKHLVFCCCTNLGVPKSDFWRPSAAAFNPRLEAVSLNIYRLMCTSQYHSRDTVLTKANSEAQEW